MSGEPASEHSEKSDAAGVIGKEREPYGFNKGGTAEEIWSLADMYCRQGAFYVL